MSEIRKYSKEWFVTGGSNQQQSNAIKNLKRNYEYNLLGNWAFDSENLTGTKEEVQNKYKTLRSNTDDTSKIQRALISRAGGIDNLFSILDADGDAKVTQDEINKVAAVDTEEFKLDDENFTLSDLKLLYENEIASEGAKLKSQDNQDIYYYKDGSITKIEKDEEGNVISKSLQKNIENDEKSVRAYYYDKNLTCDVIFDSKGRKRFASMDYAGNVNDKTITTEYNDEDNTKVVTTQTAGRIITKEYNNKNKVVSKTEELRYHSDGVIDNTKQKSIGDCWILSGVNSLRTTEKGASLIKDAIVQNPDGSVTVTLKGVNRSYTYTPDQIGAHDYTNVDKSYSDGDIDMNLIEMAITDYRKEIIPENPEERKDAIAKASPEDPVKGGYLDEAVFYLTGNKAKKSMDPGRIDKYITSKQYYDQKYALTAAFKEADPNITDGTIIKGHAYSINKVDNDYVYIVNPWDSSKEIIYPREQFMENCLQVSLVKLK